MPTTTVNVDTAIRDRLKTFGHAGMTYNEILTRLMDEVEKDRFVAELRREAARIDEEGSWVDLEDLE